MSHDSSSNWLRNFARPFGRLGRSRRRAYGPNHRRDHDASFETKFVEFQRQAERAGGRLSVRRDDCHPCLDDATPSTGFDRHYVYHTAWAARVLAATRPAEHIDIGSNLYFAATVSAFLRVRFFDYRPAELNLDSLSCGHADLTQLGWPAQSIASLSCMHVVEHVGLGRYGDPLDADGDLKAMHNLQAVLAPGGSLLFVVPVGRPRVCYNAHRVYSFDHVMAGFPELQLQQFALIPDSPREGDLIIDADPKLVAKQNYACGCFWFTRPMSPRAT